MAFPGSIPSYTGFTPGHTLLADSHASQHNLEQADITALATKIGTGASTPTSGMLLRGNGVGTSAWAQVALTTDVTGVLSTANGGTGTTLLTFPSSADTLVGRNTTDTLTNKTLTTPVIADYSNATHTHGSNAQGGQLNGATAIQSATLKSAQMFYGLVRERQGSTTGDASWATAGTSNTDTSAKDAFIQAGSVNVTGVDIAVTFPVAFTQAPIVVAGTSSIGANVYTLVSSITTTGFNIRQINDAGAGISTERAHWIAIGQ